jgi:uncharacterized membrane protein
MFNLFQNMKKTLIACGIFAALIIALTPPSGCYYDNEEERFPDLACDTVGIRYSVEIKQILEERCFKCHQAGHPSGTYSGISFETYNQLKAVADNGKLVGRTNDAGQPMPQEGLMSQCNRDKIRAWVLAGAPDN